jgi:hypothetical protein
MAVMPSILIWLALTAAVEPSASEGSGYRPSGSPDELVDLGLLARLRDPRTRPIAFGESKPSAPGGGIAEVAGPGIIQRIELTVSRLLPESFDPANVRLKVYRDGRKKPALDLSILDLFGGRHPHFPRPLVGHAAGGLYSYVPIAFRNGCRIVLDGPHSWLYRAQVSGIALPDATDVTPFEEHVSSAEQVRWDQAAALWSKPENLVASHGVRTESSDYVADGAARSTQRFLLPAGPRTIRSLEIEPVPGTSDAWRDARLKLLWEQDDCVAGVDMPLGFAFARLPGAEPGSSLLMGSTGPVWINRFPMPYRRQAFLQIDSEAAIRGTIRVRSVPGVTADAGYLRVSYCEGDLARSRSASKPIEGFPPVELPGRGHYAGTFIAVRGQTAGAHRLENADRFADHVRFVVPALGVMLTIEGAPTQPAAWDASPAHGLFLGPWDSTPGRSVGYRWHLADPIPFVRPIEATIAPGNRTRFTADSRVAVAVFWYSERPGPSSSGR